MTAVGVDEGVPAAPATVPHDAAPHRRRSRAGLLVAAALVLAVALRLHVASALWLDEALSVNIAGLPLGELHEALRRDGSPPLYYVLLHGWVAVFGGSDSAVRLLSGLMAVASLPLAFVLGARLRDRTTGWYAVLLLAASPFAVHYATEARMYSLVVLLTQLLLLALLRADEQPTPRRLVPIALVSAALAYTHYWTLFLLAVTAALLLARNTRAARRSLAAMAAGGVLLLPWLPTLLFQLRHTGTPWARPPHLATALDVVVEWSGGHGGSGSFLGLLLLGLLVVGAFGRTAASARGGRSGLLLSLPADPAGRDLLVLAGGTVLLGIVTTLALSSGFSARYSAPALAPALLVAALGLRALPGRARQVALAAVVALGLGGGVHASYAAPRTQATEVAAVVAPRARPGDVVVFCPDQLGPGVSRLLPAGLDQVVYPTAEPPRFVDWVDYAERNKAASPAAFAAALARRTTGSVFLVEQPGYRTFGRQCQRLDALLGASLGNRKVLLTARKHFYPEKHLVVRFGP